MATAARKKAGWLSYVYRKKGGRTLLVHIQEHLDSLFEQTSNGTISAVSGNGHSVSYGGEFTTGEVFELASEMEDLHNTAKARLIAAGTAAPSDEQIYNEMVFLIGDAVTVLDPSQFTELRYGIS